MEYLKLAHGLFNTVIMLFFIHQGLRGLKIRKNRINGSTPDLRVTRGHRTNGPRLALLALCGYLAGAILAFIDHGHLFHHPAHFVAGAVLTLLIGATYFVSRWIKGKESEWRNIHAAIGVAILTLYPIQILLGLGIFL